MSTQLVIYVNDYANCYYRQVIGRYRGYQEEIDRVQQEANDVKGRLAFYESCFDKLCRGGFESHRNDIQDTQIVHSLKEKHQKLLVKIEQMKEAYFHGDTKDLQELYTAFGNKDINFAKVKMLELVFVGKDDLQRRVPLAYFLSACEKGMTGQGRSQFEEYLEVCVEAGESPYAESAELMLLAKKTALFMGSVKEFDQNCRLGRLNTSDVKKRVKEYKKEGEALRAELEVYERNSYKSALEMNGSLSTFFGRILTEAKSCIERALTELGKSGKPISVDVPGDNTRNHGRNSRPEGTVEKKKTNIFAWLLKKLIWWFILFMIFTKGELLVYLDRVL